jgi:hypothetical protein
VPATLRVPSVPALLRTPTAAAALVQVRENSSVGLLPSLQVLLEWPAKPLTLLACEPCAPDPPASSARVHWAQKETLKSVSNPAWRRSHPSERTPRSSDDLQARRVLVAKSRVYSCCCETPPRTLRHLYESPAHLPVRLLPQPPSLPHPRCSTRRGPRCLPHPPPDPRM